MPQIERPTQRKPLKDLPLSLFIHPEHLKSTSLLGKKRPYSPSSVASPSKRRLLAVEGVLSPRSPFKKAVADLQRALPAANSPSRDLYPLFQRSSGSQSTSAPRQPAFLPLPSPITKKAAPAKLALGSSFEPRAYQPKPRLAEAPSTAEAELLAILAAAPKSTQVYIPGAVQGRPIRNKEDDPEEDHYPGFDIYMEGDDDDTPAQEEPHMHPSVGTEPEDEEEASKENQVPFDDYANRLATPSLSARSSMSSLGGAPRYRSSGRGRLQREANGDSSDDEFL